MNLRKALLVACSVILAVSFAACGTMRRLGKDVVVVATCPVLIPYAAGTDAASTSQEVRKGLDAGAAAEVISFVPAFFFHTIKHAFYVIIHGVDACLFWAWGLAELHPSGPEIQPLDYYQNTWFDRPGDEQKKSTDAQSGEPFTRG